MHTVFVLDQSIEKDTCHGYSPTREEWIIVHPITDFDTGRGVNVSGEKGEDIILQRTLACSMKMTRNSAYPTTMAGFDDQTQIWR